MCIRDSPGTVSVGFDGYNSACIPVGGRACTVCANCCPHRNPGFCGRYQGGLCGASGFSQPFGQTCPLNPGRIDAVMNLGENPVMGDRFGKTGFRILAYISITLAAAGVVLPLLPTTPFVLLAAFFASKGSPAFAQWLEDHPRFGPAIDQWRTRRAVPARAKVLACSMMALSWGMLFALGASAMVLGISGVFLCGTACYLVTRPSY